MVKGVRLLAAVAGATALGACADSPTGVPRSLASTGANHLVIAAGDLATVPGPALSAGAAVSYPLYAGGGGGGTGTLVGSVSVWNSAVVANQTTIHVTYNLTVGCLNETHLAIGLQLSDIPQKNGNPPPGQFANSHTLSQASCITTDSYAVLVTLGATDNGVVIAAHSVVRGVGAPVFAGADYVSGSTLTGNVVNRRPGNQVGFSVVNTPLVLAWEPTNNTDPSYWDTVISADPSGNGLALLTAGADWVWETFRTADPIQGTVIQANMTVNVPVATTGTFRVTCDNGYRVDFNGATITTGDGATAGLVTQLSNAFATDIGLATNTNLKQANVSAHGWQTVEAYNVNIVAGLNNVTLFAVNEYMNPDDAHPAFAGNGPNHIGAGPANPDPVGDADVNPAGCLFGLHANLVASGAETAWGAPIGFTGATTGFNVTGGNFPGNNWATWFTYQVR